MRKTIRIAIALLLIAAAVLCSSCQSNAEPEDSITYATYDESGKGKTDTTGTENENTQTDAVTSATEKEPAQTETQTETEVTESETTAADLLSVPEAFRVSTSTVVPVDVNGAFTSDAYAEDSRESEVYSVLSKLSVALRTMNIFSEKAAEHAKNEIQKYNENVEALQAFGYYTVFVESFCTMKDSEYSRYSDPLTQKIAALLEPFNAAVYEGYDDIYEKYLTAYNDRFMTNFTLAARNMWYETAFEDAVENTVSLCDVLLSLEYAEEALGEQITAFVENIKEQAADALTASLAYRRYSDEPIQAVSTPEVVYEWDDAENEIVISLKTDAGFAVVNGNTYGHLPNKGDNLMYAESGVIELDRIYYSDALRMMQSVYDDYSVVLYNGLHCGYSFSLKVALPSGVVPDTPYTAADGRIDELLRAAFGDEYTVAQVSSASIVFIHITESNGKYYISRLGCSYYFISDENVLSMPVNVVFPADTPLFDDLFKIDPLLDRCTLNLNYVNIEIPLDIEAILTGEEYAGREIAVQGLHNGAGFNCRRLADGTYKIIEGEL
ncbi:MAG: hypothetical protein J5940_01285 [Clostridia bacterium]|nr:hypothetical protein [Clostridia bacterium]